MPTTATLRRLFVASCVALSLGACAGTYTGPVEVTRFVAEQPSGLGQGSIVLTFPEEIENEAVRVAFASAVSEELGRLGYTVVAGSGGDAQIASVRTERNGIESLTGNSSPVSVGVGGQTGSFGTGAGVGIGINLGGGREGPSIVTDLSVRITDASGDTLWEGRAELPTSVKSPYSEVDASARVLAAALFNDFPGGNGQTVQLDVDDL